MCQSIVFFSMAHKIIMSLPVVNEMQYIMITMLSKCLPYHHSSVQQKIQDQPWLV